MNEYLNLVFEEWENGEPIANGKKQYPDRMFWDIEEFMFSYINGVSGGLKSIKTNSVNLSEISNRPNENFYYFVCHANISIEEMLNGQLPYTDEVLLCLKNNKNFYLVYQTHHESDNEQGFKALCDYAKQHQIPEKQIYIINNNSKLDEYKVKYQSDINVYSLSYLPFSAASGLRYIGGCDFIPEKTGKFFMTFNKSPKLHRYSLLVKLMNNNLLSDTNWSFIPSMKSEIRYDAYEKIFDKDEVDCLKNEIDYFNELKIKISDYETDYLTFDENNNFTMKYPKYNVGMNPELPFNYEMSYVNITTESEYFNSNNTIQITEKSFKPFNYYQFPIFFATTGHIRKLKERYNFDFFDDIINHSYDSIQDDKLRFKMAFDEILKLNNSKDYVIDFYKNNQQRFEDNREKVLNVSGKETDYYFYKKLIN